MRPNIDVTVAAVCEHEGRFLIVEESIAGRRVFNQPAGHVECGESVIEAAVRETREESGYEFMPQSVVGMYTWYPSDTERGYLRLCLSGPACAPQGPVALDDGIVAVHWLTRAQLLANQAKLRSPLVLQAIDDFLAGARFPLSCCTHIAPETNLTEQPVNG